MRPRPSQEAEGLRWDLETGAAYETALKSGVAMQHLMEVIRLEREEMIRKLVAEDARGDEYRAAIRMADRLLRVPEKMIQDGHESGRLLIGVTDG